MSTQRVPVSGPSATAGDAGSPESSRWLSYLRLKKLFGTGAENWLVAPILLLAATLRFDGLSGRGLLYWDEGKFALEGIRLQSVLYALPHLNSAVLEGKAVGTAKPMHALLIALSYDVFGIHDYAPIFLDATASILQIVVLFALGRLMFGTRIALVAAAFLAVSGYDIVYARSALSESDANLLFMLGVLLWWYGRESRSASGQWAGRMPRFFSAILMAAAFTTNYRLIVYISTVVAIDLFVIWRQKGWRTVASSLVLWAAGLSILPILWQAIGAVAHAHGVILFRSEITYQPSSYFGEVLYQLHGGKQSVFRFNPLLYPEWYLVRQGWPLSLLLLGGLAVAAVVQTYRWIMPAALVVLPYLVYTFAPFIVPRNLDPVLPFAALLAAAALVTLIDRFGLRPIHLAGIALVLVASGVLPAWQLTEVRSGFAQAASYVDQHRSPGALVVNEVMVFYLRDRGVGCDAPRLPKRLALLAARDGAGGDYAIIDKYTSPVAIYLARHGRIVARFPVTGNASLGEDLIASENGYPPLRQARYVDVYPLDSLHLPDRYSAKQSCTMDRLA